MKYPNAGDLQRKMSVQLSNPARANPYEVRSASGLEGVFANEDDAEFHADELRRSGVSGVRVERRERQRGGMTRSNPSSDFGGPYPDWAKSNEDAVRDALARSSTEIADALKRHPEAVLSSERARYLESDFKRPDWKRVYVLTEYGIGDPFTYAQVHRAFDKAVELLKRITGEEWMWDSINPGKQMFVMLDRERRNPSRDIIATVTNDRGKSFNVRVVRKGDRYGLNDKLIHDKDDPLVEFYDATYESDPRFDLGRGQFVSRYYYSTLTGRDRYGRDLRDGRSGMSLDMSSPQWSLTGANIAEALAAVEAELGMRANPAVGYLMPVGASLRDELVEEIDSTDWDNVDSDGVPFADRAAKVKSLLLGATKQGKGFAIDTRSLTSKDYEFLSDNLEDGVAWNMRNVESSRGVRMGELRRQIRDLREAIGRFGGVLPEENPAGLTAKGERMYRQVKRGYQERGEPRAAEIASRTVLARSRSTPGLKKR